MVNLLTQEEEIKEEEGEADEADPTGMVSHVHGQPFSPGTEIMPSSYI